MTAIWSWGRCLRRCPSLRHTRLIIHLMAGNMRPFLHHMHTSRHHTWHVPVSENVFGNMVMSEWTSYKAIPHASKGHCVTPNICHVSLLTCHGILMESATSDATSSDMSRHPNKVGHIRCHIIRHVTNGTDEKISYVVARACVALMWQPLGKILVACWPVSAEMSCC